MMKKTGTKDVVAIKTAIKDIQKLTELFKRKRLSQDEYVLRVNKKLASMDSERDYIQYLQNIGQF
jgi:hypothetical protein